MAVLKDVAALAGVSVRTVGRVLNDSGYADAVTRDRVQAAAKRLGYRANRTARSLRTGRSLEVIVLMAALEEVHVLKLTAMEAALRTAGYSLHVVFARADSVPRHSNTEILALIAESSPAAVAILPRTTLSNAAFAQFCQEEKIPCVFVDPRTSCAANRIVIDRTVGHVAAVHHLARQGRQRICFVGQAHDPSHYDGFLQGMAELGREPLTIAYDITAGDRFELGRAAAAKCLAMPNRPDAVQMYSDLDSLGFMAGLYEAGIRIPEDIAVVGFDDREFARMTYPPLTTVAQPSIEAGHAAAAMLLDGIAGRDDDAEPRVVTLPTHLVIRKSA